MNLDTIKCPECGRPIKYGKDKCFYCGASMEGIKPKIKCKKCKTLNPDTNKFCMECGEHFYEESQYVPVMSRIPPPEPELDMETITIRSITFSNEEMLVEKGYPPQPYTIILKDIKEVNVYRSEEHGTKADPKKGKATGKMLASIATDLVVPGLGVAIRARGNQKLPELKSLKEILLCEIITVNSKELIIGDKFDYGKTLGPEKEFNLTNNFTKLIKKILHHCEQININRGTELIISKQETQWE